MKTLSQEVSTLSMQLAETFSIVDNCLEIGGISLERLAEQVGQKPFFVYSRRHIDERVNLLREHIPPQVSIHYAVKANPFVPLVHYMASKVEGVDIASASELLIALNAGVDPQDISFAGPGKNDADLKQAIAARILINVESENELHRIHAIAQTLNERARIALRVNPDYRLNSSGMRMGGGPLQFGMDVQYVKAVLGVVRDYPEYLQFEGFQIFPGSQNLNADHIIEAQHKALDLVITLARESGVMVQRFNLGGGFGVPYFEGDQELDLPKIGLSMQQLVDKAEAAMPGVEIILELGRYLVAPAGIYVTKVVERKVSHDVVYLVTEGGMNHHLAASGHLGQLIRRNYPIVIGNRVAGETVEKVNVVGPLCTPLDVLLNQGTLTVAHPGDLVAIFQSGAYGLSASPVGFLSQTQAVEILI
ncbi:L-glutamyl-[BtrI acyl-carrier protein] decarboxylase [Vibrio ruber DSM 16370]|uniref:L-glutamyl-[BtrI acyl-carrier protein] decarboxylase n=1 Tax=Vibrio ruber (strain DSM 16370 / JCM 11486 / BCRC 17186 / CECT 7878 / LMG 23124 / VR1) TaxID=1123498 RepID=A0A1R4LDI2_VIBR1|nr:pyridoxal-dependent decarboxylase, exosortase A system-associated [Vibrio ruber]SJN54618.1 L-glutamyl-[BtrI acyl-carrier protein] decarboxylase [Vibrio ruber DSM 16370]